MTRPPYEDRSDAGAKVRVWGRHAGVRSTKHAVRKISITNPKGLWTEINDPLEPAPYEDRSDAGAKVRVWVRLRESVHPGGRLSIKISSTKTNSPNSLLTKISVSSIILYAELMNEVTFSDTGQSPSGKALDSDSSIRRFESFLPSD